MNGRTVHIQRSNRQSGAPAWDIIDAGHYGEDGATAQVLHALTDEQVADWLARAGLKYSAIRQALNELSNGDSIEVQLPLRAGPRLVRAWFDTVLNPLIQSLESESILLRRKNWTFTSRPPRLDLIRSVKEYVSYDSLPNLDQVIRSSDESLLSAIQKHDDLVEQLTSSVIETHRFLANDPQFRSVCDLLMSTEALAELKIEDPAEVFGGYPFSERYDLLAQYVVNNTSALSSHYSTAKFWNRHRNEFTRMLIDLSEVRTCYSESVRLGGCLASETEGLLVQLRDLRDRLSMEYDVPLVTGTR